MSKYDEIMLRYNKAKERKTRDEAIRVGNENAHRGAAETFLTGLRNHLGWPAELWEYYSAGPDAKDRVVSATPIINIGDHNARNGISWVRLILERGAAHQDVAFETTWDGHLHVAFHREKEQFFFHHDESGRKADWDVFAHKIERAMTEHLKG